MKIFNNSHHKLMVNKSAEQKKSINNSFFLHFVFLVTINIYDIQNTGCARFFLIKTAVIRKSKKTIYGRIL